MSKPFLYRKRKFVAKNISNAVIAHYCQRKSMQKSIVILNACTSERARIYNIYLYISTCIDAL